MTQTTHATSVLDDLPEKVAALLADGMSLGDMYGYTETDYEAIYALGHHLYEQQRYLDAAKAFGYLVIHNQLERRYVNAFASSLQMLKMYRDAIQFYCMASVMDLEDPLPTFHTAECMIALGMTLEARQALELVVKQSEAPVRAELKQRAQALLELLGNEDKPPSDGSRSPGPGAPSSITQDDQT